MNYLRIIVPIFLEAKEFESELSHPSEKRVPDIPIVTSL